MWKSALALSFTFALGGCIPWPIQIIEPLDVSVVDATTGQPLANVEYLRIVCDVHDFTCAHARVDAGLAADGHLALPGRRDWGPWTPVPGGLPAPNHQIAIWKPGYQAFVFSQYDDDIDSFASKIERLDIKRQTARIPHERTYLHSAEPEKILRGGIIRLQRAGAPDQSL